MWNYVDVFGWSIQSVKAIGIAETIDSQDGFAWRYRLVEMSEGQVKMADMRNTLYV